MMNEDPIMNDEQAEEAVAKFLEDNPELLRGIVPERDLWPSIESRISARVIPMSARSAGAATRVWGWLPMLAAASALVVASAGITYVFTSRAASHRDAPGATASTSTIHGAPDSNSTTATKQVASSGPAEAAIAHDDVALHANPGSTDIEREQRANTQLASHSVNAESDQVRATYDSEITTLHAALDARRAQLNPATVAVIEQNLRVIDEAISQSEAALARDPNSSLLNDQLDRTLAKKTGLLRAAALLPAA